MRHTASSRATTAVIAFLARLSSARVASLEEGFTPMFKGKDQACWEGTPAGFEVRAEYRLAGAAANSGIQFRSRELPD